MPFPFLPVATGALSLFPMLFSGKRNKPRYIGPLPTMTPPPPGAALPYSQAMVDAAARYSNPVSGSVLASVGGLNPLAKSQILSNLGQEARGSLAGPATEGYGLGFNALNQARQSNYQAEISRIMQNSNIDLTDFQLGRQDQADIFGGLGELPFSLASLYLLSKGMTRRRPKIAAPMTLPFGRM